MRKIQFANQQFYHIYNRGVEKRNIFLDKNDHIRFIHNLYEFNDIKLAQEYSRLNVGGLASHIRKRERLVDIVCFCLMPNHFHLLLRQIKDGGITAFLHKLSTGYTMAFNLKNKRTGSLFQGPFKAAQIKDDNYLIHLSRYIHLNPLEIKKPNWKEAGIIDWSAAEEFLKSYRWSSYLDFIGCGNFPSIINERDFILEFFDKDILKYRKFVQEWTIKDTQEISDIIIE